VQAHLGTGGPLSLCSHKRGKNWLDRARTGTKLIRQGNPGLILVEERTRNPGVLKNGLLIKKALGRKAAQFGRGETGRTASFSKKVRRKQRET